MQIIVYHCQRLLLFLDVAAEGVALVGSIGSRKDSDPSSFAWTSIYGVTTISQSVDWSHAPHKGK